MKKKLIMGAIIFIFCISFIVNTQAQVKETHFSYYFLIGGQFNKRTYNNVKNEQILPLNSLIYCLGLNYSKKIYKNHSLGLSLAIQSGGIVRNFNFQYEDSTKKLKYSSHFDQNWISYGLGIKYKYKISKKFEVFSSLNYNYLFITKYNFHDHRDYDTPDPIKDSTIIGINNVDKKNDFFQYNFGINYMIGKNSKNAITIVYNNSIGKPIIGTFQYYVNNKNFADNSFKTNFWTISIGYIHYLKF